MWELRCPVCCAPLRTTKQRTDKSDFRIMLNTYKEGESLSLEEKFRWSYILDELIGPPFSDDPPPELEDLVTEAAPTVQVMCWCCTWSIEIEVEEVVEV